MTATKRPSTSSLRRFINSRPYVALSEIRRRFGLEETDEVTRVTRNGTTAVVGLPEREALQVADLWQRGEIGLEFSVEVRAPAVVGIYPMRVVRYAMGPHPNGGSRPQAQPPQNGSTPASHSSNGRSPTH